MSIIYAFSTIKKMFQRKKEKERVLYMHLKQYIYIYILASQKLQNEDSLN